MTKGIGVDEAAPDRRAKLAKVKATKEVVVCYRSRVQPMMACEEHMLWATAWCANRAKMMAQQCPRRAHGRCDVRV